MIHRLGDRIKFVLERWLQRGAGPQLLIIAALIGLVALLFGLVAQALGGFDSPGHAIWWAFLRLTDPGYLGDDEGVGLRIVSTIVTVLGYVLFMGSLIAILTQWLKERMDTLERGLTPIAVSNHILILGWTNRTVSIVHELVRSEGRVRRFLQRRGARRLRIVILADEVGAARMLELRERIGGDWDEGQVILRSGSSLRVEHLRRVDFTNAGVIVLPGADFALGGSESTDTRIIKTLMSISLHGEKAGTLPPVVAEVFDVHKVAIARQAYGGVADIVASDALISRLIAQNVRHPGLSYVYAELLSHARGNEVYVRSWSDLAGLPFHEVGELFLKAIPLGLVRPEAEGFHTLLNPPDAVVLEQEDRLILLARTYEEAVPEGARRVAAEPAAAVQRVDMAAPQRRILILGWNHKVSALLREFGSYRDEPFAIDILSVVPVEERTAALARVAAGETALRHLEGDYTVEAELLDVRPNQYDNVILLSSDWLETSEESDARTLLGYVLLRTLLEAHEEQPQILVELMDPENARLFRHRSGEVIISPRILSHMLSHVALRRELHAVFGELFGPGGAEFYFRTARAYRLAGQTASFQDIRKRAAEYGEIALGVRLHAERNHEYGGVRLNPKRTARWTLKDNDEIIVLTTYR